MILIGLTTWSDHPSLIHGKNRKVTLSEYAQHFPVVEVDNPFYGIPKIKTVENWQKQVPNNFQFILKANYLMTKHHLPQFGEDNEQVRRETFMRYGEMVDPLVNSNQLASVLFQFPPYFRLNNDNIRYLRLIREWMGSLPISIEFRNPSWYGDEISHDVHDYLKSLKMSEVVVDEPHNLSDGVPFEPFVTDKNFVMMRLHGQNQKGWFEKSSQWRKKRTLYRYNEDELKHFAEVVNDLQKQAKVVCVIFNNNSGHDAADNALQLKKILGLNFGGLAPMQLDLF